MVTFFCHSQRAQRSFEILSTIHGTPCIPTISFLHILFLFLLYYPLSIVNRGCDCFHTTHKLVQHFALEPLFDGNSPYPFYSCIKNRQYDFTFVSRFQVNNAKEARVTTCKAHIILLIQLPIIRKIEMKNISQSTVQNGENVSNFLSGQK